MDLGPTPAAARTTIVANGTFTGNTNFTNILFRPHANNNLQFRNLVFTANTQTSDPGFDRGDIYSNEVASIGDEVFSSIYFYSRPNQVQPFAKIGATTYQYSVAGDLAAFNTATGATNTFKNVDPMLISATDFRTKATSPLRRADTSYPPCSDARGRVCWNPPDIGAYQASSGDLAAPR